MTLEDQITGLETAIVTKDQRIAELESELASTRASLDHLIETGLASIQAQDECVATFVDLNLSLQEELSDAKDLIDDTFDELVETDRRAQTLELQLLATTSAPSMRRAN